MTHAQERAIARVCAHECLQRELVEALEIADKFCGSLTSDVCPDWVHIPIREALAKARGEAA